MAIVTMKKLTLVGMQNNKDALLDALIATQCIQLKPVQPLEDCQTGLASRTYDELLTKLNKIEDTMTYINTTVETYNSENKHNSNFVAVKLSKPSFSRPLIELSYSQLNATQLLLDNIFDSVDTVDDLRRKIMENTATINNINSQLARLALYEKLPKPIDSYCDSQSSFVMLGTVPIASLQMLQSLITEEVLAAIEVVSTDNDNALVVVVAHKLEQEFVGNVSALGFVRCNIKLSCLPVEQINTLQANKSYCYKIIADCVKLVAEYAGMMTELKLASDYINIQLAKVVADGSLPKTATVFVLEGFFPAKNEDVIVRAIDTVSANTVVYVDEIAREETAPIMYSNSKLVSNFEGVTNMYTPPDYHEFDPNTVMSFFYFIIFGLMVADIGYGLVLALAGLLGRILIRQKTGVRSLISLFGICGLSAIGVGALYGSCFSYPLFAGILPDAGIYPKTTMVICLLFGLFHIMAGFALSMAKRIKDKEYVLAYGVSMMWILFFAGLFLALLQPALQFMDYPPFASVVLPAIVGKIGLALIIASLVIVLICAGGSGKKGLMGRLMSAFGSLYGILNYFGDVMSYIRIFGLMLSSAMMGVVINDLGVLVASNGVFGQIMSVVLLVFAHSFNLIIGVLGVYIHNGRLQYVEFFGKFYEGEGELFVPFGHNTKYTLLVNSNINGVSGKKNNKSITKAKT